MGEFRCLTDFDIEKIITFVNEREFINGPEMFVSNRLFIEPFKRESSLRPILFEGRMLFFGEIESDEIKQIAFISFPDPNSKSNVASIYQLSKNRIFINKMIEFVRNYLQDSLYSKLRLSIYDNEKNRDLIDVLLESGFVCEADLSTAMGNKKLLSLMLKEEIAKCLFQ